MDSRDGDETTFQTQNHNMKSKEDRFLELMSSIDINNPAMDFDAYGNKLFWFDKEGNYICHYNLESEWFWFRYDKIWSVFETEYGLHYTEINIFMEGMVEEHFRLKDVTLCSGVGVSGEPAEQHFKLKDVTPFVGTPYMPSTAEQHFRLKDVISDALAKYVRPMVEQHFKLIGVI